jgi:uncharacterized lipoprotein YmbA
MLPAALASGLAACAGPPLTLYTLGADPAGPAENVTEPRTIVAVQRVSIPDALDTQDILIRDGSTMKRSTSSRWAERLSLGITDLITAELAARNPQALVTDQPQSGPITTRLAINISQLDITTAGTVTLAADWTWIPANPTQPLRRARTRVTLNANTSTDAGTVQAFRTAVAALAVRIEGAGGVVAEEESEGRGVVREHAQRGARGPGRT